MQDEPQEIMPDSDDFWLYLEMLDEWIKPSPYFRSKRSGRDAIRGDRQTLGNDPASGKKILRSRDGKTPQG